MFKHQFKTTEYMLAEKEKREKEYDILKSIGDLNFDFSFLKQVLSDEDGDYADITLKEKENKQNVIVFLSSLKTLSPLLKKALNFSEDKKKQTEYILKLNEIVINQSKKFVKNLLNLEPDDKNNTWIVNVLASFFHSSIPDELLYEEINEDYFSNLISKALFYIANENMDENKLKDYSPFPLHIGVQLALIKSLTGIINAQNYYDFYRNREDDLKIIISQIFKNCANSMSELVLPSTAEQDKLMLFKMLLEESSKLFIDCWYNSANKTIEYFKKNNTNAEQIKEKYPDGIPIDKLMTTYNKNHSTLINLIKLVK